MTSDDLAKTLESNLTTISGEQFTRWTDERGDSRFATWVGGIRVYLSIERWGSADSVLIGHSLIAGRVASSAEAAAWVAERNSTLRVGRIDHTDDTVAFTHALFSSSVTVSSLRSLLALLALETLAFPDLASRVGGALKPSDAADLKDL